MQDKTSLKTVIKTFLAYLDAMKLEKKVFSS